MKILATLAAVAALSIGLAGTTSAATPDAELGPQITKKETSIAQAACFYRYFYVTDGYN